MTQTATALSTDQVLNIHETGPAAALTINTPGSQAPALPKEVQPVKQLLVEGTFYSSTSWLSYGDKVKLSFAVKDAYHHHFILIRGLLEFHRSAGFSLSYNKGDKTFEIVASASTIHFVDEVNRFLRKIGAWLDQEISFKQQLKEMIAFERAYRTKLAKVYQGGEGFTLFPVV